MRPDVLFPLFKAITTLPGVGQKVAEKMERLIGGAHVVDLLWHLPNNVVDRRASPKVADAPDGVVCTLTIRVGAHQPGRNRRSPYKVVCHDDTGQVVLVFFHARGDYLVRQLPEGEVRVVSGRVEHYNGQIQMTHPDYIVPLADKAEVERVEPVYPMTAGLSPKTLGKAIKGALDAAPDTLPEWLDRSYQDKHALPPWYEAISQAHAPESAAELSAMAKPRMRLAYDEMLSNQLALALVRRDLKRLAGRPIAGDRRLRDKVTAALPFALTGAQARSLEEIYADMGSSERMLRLLQGDVGSGKTVVALLALLNAVECGLQGALMAPTEILARQHYDGLLPLAEAAGVRIEIITGRDKGKARTEKLAALESGTIDIAIGTHALFQKDIAFQDLGLAVIDEQHRFGVHQRLGLSDKGKATDVLVMTATPIPRTLTLTAYGDMDVSRLDEKPPGRQPVQTITKPLNALGDIVAAVQRAVNGGAKVYWVCPLVEESETSDMAAAEARFVTLKNTLGERVGLVHGRMKGPEKDAVMEAFAGPDLDVLVATTVIEVGVNVPEATVMVIEHAERFGLAQLHQLRGRIGRGSGKSTCILLYASPLSETARDRLDVMRRTEDGFVIAEEDLRLRGAGEVLGTRQSGLPTFRLADLAVHGDLLATARKDVQMILERDPKLESDRGKALRVLLYLFSQDSVIKTLRSG